MKVAISGHRPEKITNWKFVHTQLMHAFNDFKADVVIQGMAAGVDLMSAKVAHNMHIPFWAVRPWAGHKPRKCDELDYSKAIMFAEKLVNVNDSEKYPGAWVYQKRNEWMVDHADFVVAVWDGTSGGTANCVKYAIKKELPVWRINPSTHEVGWIAYGPQTKTLHE